ncbi:MAG: aa3-type cytochrome c oxidase subunit IV [Pseudomonadota bacterium]
MAEHEHGTMDVTEQQKTFDGFMAWVVRTIVASIAVLLFLAIFNS